MYKILLIEDDLLLRQSIRTALGQQLYQITATGDGQDGMLKAAKGLYDLIILDLILPGKNGFLISKQIRSNLIDTPILIISTRHEIGDLMTAFDSGVDGYLCKPFNLLELKCRVQAILKRPPHAQFDRYTIHDLTIDCNTGLLYKGNQEINLPNKQFQILRYLCANPERTISKKELLNSLWEFDSNTMLNTIDVHVSKLRKHLAQELGQEDQLITTIHGKGYRIKAS